MHGEALAYNCVGVDYMKLGETEPKYYKDAVDFHTKHNKTGTATNMFTTCYTPCQDAFHLRALHPGVGFATFVAALEAAARP